jgi:alpha-mannosidase
LNRQPLILPGAKALHKGAPVHLVGDGVSLEVLKKAEREEAFIVRVVETRGARAHAKLETTLTGATLAETDMMEWNDGKSVPMGSSYAFSLFPFEIKTFKIRHVGP